MNKKDLKSLMEAYDEVASIEISPEEIDAEHEHNEEMGEPHEHGEDLDFEDLEHEKIEMVETRLRSIIAHAHQALDAIKKGSVIEPWMEELIAISADNIVNTSNSLTYKHHV